MNSPIKALLWTGSGASIAVMALWGVLQQVQVQDAVLIHTAAHIQNQEHTVAYGKETLPRIDSSGIPGPGTYSGLQMLYGMRGWAAEGAEIVVDGEVIQPIFPDLNDPAALYDQDLYRLLGVIDLSASYTASVTTERAGGLITIQFKRD
ncbi:hypothetical protein [Paenibacillus brevis]|uniref:Uncharacterized protein n=1 Tax=Paenibacillus brevis TaxID=2841508 RepID=A0ABS6FSQ2_9BACL|nr:hypothetical protein [Paenibacillus brevis]MBU5672497.1 hypothetical protein [Paenibacillus brevis]